jgi:CheY-like chemotaxis protein
MDEDIERSQAAGFADHLTKPVSIDRLQAAISQLEEEAD